MILKFWYKPTRPPKHENPILCWVGTGIPVVGSYCLKTRNFTQDIAGLGTKIIIFPYYWQDIVPPTMEDRIVWNTGGSNSEC